jgi:hypothetical protein
LDSGEVTQKSREEQQKKEAPIPTRVKVITHDNQKCILSSFGFTKNKPIEYKNYGKKYSKCKRVEKHILVLYEDKNHHACGKMVFELFIFIGV